MGNFNLKIGVFLLTAATVLNIVAPTDREMMSCKKFSKLMRNATSYVEHEEIHNSILEKQGFVAADSVFDSNFDYKCTNALVKSAEIHTTGAQNFKSKFGMSAEDFETLAVRCHDFGRIPDKCTKKETSKVHQKYRSIDGRNNNLKNPNWGASGTPFSRFGSRNYDDGIYSIKKSVTGSDLPNARLLVQEVLTKAVRSPPPSLTYSLLGLLIILFATHDLHFQVPMQPKSAEKQIQCCSQDRHAVLPPNLSHSACLPIEVSKDDSFYKDDKIGCLNIVRSQIGEFPNDVQTGQILNHATAYLDLSLIYGNHESETNQVRLFEHGKFRMGKNNVLPVDSNGRYIQSMNRFVAVPIATIWPTLFARNHNHLAERLALLNPHWNDEILFQEARRINIANFQYNLIAAKSIERVFNRPVNESYSDVRNAGILVEFSYTYRGAHYYVPSDMLFLNENYTQTKQIRHSDAIGRIDLLENGFDDALRGVADQLVNTGPYSDEIINRVGKNGKTGYGMDLIATDIQRSRDHGIPSFVEIRRKCKLSPQINSFDDFNLILNKTNVDLLKKSYKSYEDVDFYVGGLLEAFENVANPFAGPTFGCVIGENYNNVMGGDIYFFSHPENPYPMTKGQLDAINKYSVSHLFCTNSGLKETNKLWSYATPHPMNPKIDCKNFPPMDLSAWKE